MLDGKRILLGIGGGIAVYRVAELTRLLIKAGASVRCVMTRSACEFVTPLTFEALTGEQVHDQLFDLTGEREMGHIKLARWADAVIIAPATASLLARLAHGIADDLLSTIMQVCDKPVLLAPAMNTSMWESAASQHNISTLKQRGMFTVGPAIGLLACGEQGAGRLAELPDIIAALMPLLTEQSLKGQDWVINAGPTHESWDGVRLLSNRASGKLGQLLAEQALIRGAAVTLIAGPGTPTSSANIKRIDIESAEQMLTACTRHAAGKDIFIGTAAVSDYRFTHRQDEKLKRGDAHNITVQLEANPDIIAFIAAMQHRPRRVIAFAAESTNHIDYAKIKLQQKNVDAIVANDICNMGHDQAGGWWISHHSEHTIERSTKSAFAQHIINHIMELL
ncbi:MAG: bifunctional phosphopantothenoylcysteine decarboxylase/phosphopantothenate--cysteine ligase CoaBC [Mariprofundus sp.]|nr:bifunctional phosphopantothenoylcysteine decarboxylase/phosphopantothenate--cysteine ligase CoaBC [Mariprofundus sp.]